MLARKGRWQPGQSGNPKGRPSIEGPVEVLARARTEEALRTLVELMRTGVPDAVKGAAANALLNRGWGMPRQTVGVEADLKPVEQMTLAEVEAELARLKADVVSTPERHLLDRQQAVPSRRPSRDALYQHGVASQGVLPRLPSCSR
jgi:Family of unknown function (DUF5681)